LRKNNTGYDLKHLFIGAEGTLGIITAAVLKLYPAIHAREAALVALSDPESVLDLFVCVRDACGDALTAFEMISRMPFDFALKHSVRMRDPFEAPHPFYALIELTSPRPGGALRKTLQAVLAQAIEDGFAKDAVIATSEAQAKELWTIREDINEAQIPEGGSIKHDVSVPISRVPEFLRRATDILERAVPGGRVIAFGHVGDGNIHFNLSQPEGADTDAFMADSNRVVHGVHDLVAEMEGSFSAEHGIGLHKRDLLKHYKSDVEMDLMWTVKRSLDAKSIMNLGKLL
jgi:D-lactate dehydrogenase (cytochrome)